MKFSTKRLHSITVVSGTLSVESAIESQSGFLFHAARPAARSGRRDLRSPVPRRIPGRFVSNKSHKKEEKILYIYAVSKRHPSFYQIGRIRDRKKIVFFFYAARPGSPTFDRPYLLGLPADFYAINFCGKSILSSTLLLLSIYGHRR